MYIYKLNVYLFTIEFTELAQDWGYTKLKQRPLVNQHVKYLYMVGCIFICICIWSDISPCK